MSNARAVVRRRLQGVAFLVVLVLLLGLAVAQYNKTFADVAHVTLQDRHRGQPAAGRLRRQGPRRHRRRVCAAVHGRRRGATIDLAMDPQYLTQIPADVSARLLPKTLFGERYVSLVAARPADHRSGWPTATSSARTAPETPSSCRR